MKHSIKERSPRSQKGHSKGKSQTKRLGPIEIEEILQPEAPHSKYDVTVREMNVRTDPTNEASPIIRRKFKPLDNPETILEVLQGILVIKEGVIGDNVTTGPLQCACWRGCLRGTALAKFNEFAALVGTETSAHLPLVERRLVTHFAPREVLSLQAKHVRHRMRQPADVTTRQYVGAVTTLNRKMESFPPNFNADQKVAATDLLDILASKAPKNHKELLTDHGFDPQTETMERFVEICERAETKFNLAKGKAERRFESDDDSDSSGSPKKKVKKMPKKKQAYQKKQNKRFYCSEHGPNNTHDTKHCKVLNHGNSEEKPDWKKKNRDGGKCKDCQSKHKKKQHELNLLQAETKRSKAKWEKACKKLKSDNSSEAGEVSSNEETSRAPTRATVRTFTPREHQRNDASESSSESSSSSTSSEDSHSE